MVLYTISLFDYEYTEVILLEHEKEFTHEEYTRMVNEAIIKNKNTDSILRNVPEYLIEKYGFTSTKTIDYGIGIYDGYNRIKEYDEDIHDSEDFFGESGVIRVL